MIVVAGEALIDLVPDGEMLRAMPGGSPVNVAVGLARLGDRVAFLGRLSSDGFGRALTTRLAGEGVDLGLAATTGEPTTLAVVHLGGGGRAEYRFYLEGTSAAGLRTSQLPDLPDGAALHLSLGAVGLATMPAAGAYRDLLAREAGRRFVSIDPNVRSEAIGDPAAYRGLLEEALVGADLVKASDEDLDLLHPGRDPLAIARAWRELGPAVVVVTRGERGASAIGPGGVVEVGGEAVTVADTVGAGDAFTSALLSWLAAEGALGRAALERLSGQELTAALAHAARGAALACTRRGADPPRRGDW